MARRVYFLDVKNWEQYGFINSNIDVNKLNPIIQRVQRTRIESVLGTTLYNRLITDAPNFEGIYKTLVDDHIIPTMIAYCDWKYTFHGTNQLKNKTVGKNNDQHITSNSENDNNNLRDELIKDAKVFERKMIGWLMDNREEIPEYYDTETDKYHQSIKPAEESGVYYGKFIIT